MIGRPGSRWKFWVRAALVVVFALDVGLGVTRWRMSIVASQEELQLTALRLRTEVAAVRTNLDRAEAVRSNMPRIAADCERFYGDELLGPKQGYAALVADLGNIAHDAGLVTSGVRFDEKDSSEPGFTEVDATAVIEGNYQSLIRFVNGLEQAKNFYVLDSLQLASSNGSQVKLSIRLHTYFRS